MKSNDASCIRSRGEGHTVTDISTPPGWNASCITHSPELYLPVPIDTPGWAKRGTMRVTYPAQEHDTMTSGQLARSEV